MTTAHTATPYKRNETARFSMRPCGCILSYGHYGSLIFVTFVKRWAPTTTKAGAA